MEHSTLVGHSILVFEGDPRLAGYLRETLEGAGARVALASSIAEALAIIEAAELSAADYRLGVEGGQAVARRLTALELPFVFWSRQDLTRYAAWPNAPVISKPDNRRESVETLRRLLRSEIVAKTVAVAPSSPAPAGCMSARAGPKTFEKPTDDDVAGL